MKTIMKIHRDEGIDAGDLTTAVAMLRGNASHCCRVKLFINGQYRDVTGALLLEERNGERYVVLHAEQDAAEMPDHGHIKLARDMRTTRLAELRRDHPQMVDSVPRPQVVALETETLRESDMLDLSEEGKQRGHRSSWALTEDAQETA